MAVYTCWGDDQEDLTSKVEAAIREGGHITIQRAMDRDATDTNAVIVLCSKGHQNVFQIAKD